MKLASASLEDIDWGASRELDRNLVTALAGGDRLRNGHNVLITGATGVGKTWLASALARQAARSGFMASSGFHPIAAARAGARAGVAVASSVTSFVAAIESPIPAYLAQEADVSHPA